jgi:tetratricopeptide (TPR) repeat protein
MNPFDRLPHRDENRRIEAEAVAALRAAISECGYFQEQGGGPDYGTDVELEVLSKGAVTNLRVHVQIKGTSQPAKGDNSVSIEVDRTNLNYLLQQPDSIYVCYHLPTRRLLVEYALDVVNRYERLGRPWQDQKRLTIQFASTFDCDFQAKLSRRLIAEGEANRSRRLRHSATPPEQIGLVLSEEVAHIEVPTSATAAKSLLAALYDASEDRVISAAFPRFAAVLSSNEGDMNQGYMAEVNLGMNGGPCDEGRVREALIMFQKAESKGAGFDGAWRFCQGNAWFALKEYSQAEEVYLGALSLLTGVESRKVAAMCAKNLGATLKELGRFDAERAAYEQALTLDSDLSEAHFGLGLWHLRHGRNLRQALRHLDLVVGTRGSDLQMANVQGWRMAILFQLSNYDGAFRDIRTLLLQADRLNWVWPWCAQQVATFGRQSTESAGHSLRFWRGYLQAHPDDLFALRERFLCLSLLHGEGEGLEIAFADFKRDAVRLAAEHQDDDAALIWDRVGHWAQAEGDWDEAESAYRRAYDIDPATYGYCLGTALNFLGRYDEALPILLPQATEHQPDGLSWFQVARAREGVGDTDGCVAAYNEALTLDPDYALAWFNLGGVHWNSGARTLALGVWREAILRFPDHELAAKLRSFLPLFREG